MVHSGLPSYIGNGWGCAAGQCHLQNAACPRLLRARLSFDRAYEFLLLGLCIAHHVEPQPRFMKSQFFLRLSELDCLQPCMV